MGDFEGNAQKIIAIADKRATEYKIKHKTSQSQSSLMEDCDWQMLNNCAWEILNNFEQDKKYDLCILYELLRDDIAIALYPELIEKLFKNAILQKPDNVEFYLKFCLYIRMFVVEGESVALEIERAIKEKNMKVAFECAMKVVL